MSAKLIKVAMCNKLKQAAAWCREYYPEILVVSGAVCYSVWYIYYLIELCNHVKF